MVSGRLLHVDDFLIGEFSIEICTDKHGLTAHGKSRSSRPFRHTSAALGIDSVLTIQYTMRRPRNTLRTVHKVAIHLPGTFHSILHRLALPLTIPHAYMTPHPSYSPPMVAWPQNAAAAAPRILLMPCNLPSPIYSDRTLRIPEIPTGIRTVRLESGISKY